MDQPTKKDGHTIPAGEFKVHCLSLMDQVNRTGEEIVITKHRKVVARLVPAVRRPLRPFIGRTKGSLHVTGDLIAPVGPDWEPGEDY